MLTDAKRNAQSVSERAELVNMLNRRVAHWNKLAKPAGLHYPRYDGGFFTTVFCDNAHLVAENLRKKGIYLVPLAGALRVAMCSVSEPHIERIVAALAAELG